MIKKKEMLLSFTIFLSPNESPKDDMATIIVVAQKRALFLHLAGPTVQDIFNNSIPAELRGGAKDYDKAMDCLSDHFKFRKNAPMARQAFLAATPTVGETINNFITRLQKLAKHCEYEAERDNQVQDWAISFIKDRNLKSKLYCEANEKCRWKDR